MLQGLKALEHGPIIQSRPPQTIRRRWPSRQAPACGSSSRPVGRSAISLGGGKWHELAGQHKGPGLHGNLGSVLDAAKRWTDLGLRKLKAPPGRIQWSF